MRKWLAIFCLSMVIFPASLMAKELPKADEEEPGPFEVKPLDGVLLEAVETYANPRGSEFGFGSTIYPFSPFYNGFGVTANYTHYFGETLAWEIINAGYFFPVSKGLLTDLADEFARRPEELVETLNFTLNSNFLYVFSYGKLILFKKYLRYFRASILGGAGSVSTNNATGIAVNAGLRMDFYITGSFSLRIDARENVAFGNIVKSYLTFGLGTGIAF